MQKSSFWTGWFKPVDARATRKWTIEELRQLYDVLLKNEVVTESNRAVVVETIRSIVEYILWGDQNEPRIFDFFLENNILTYLHKVLLQPANRTGEVAKQVLQTLSIIIQNVRSETGIFFLFSNNHINAILDLEYDWSDEEVLGYYVSFLKTISLKLNPGTVHFFLNPAPAGRRFPLYTRAIRLAHNREGMVRAAVRTLTLHVYSLGDPDITALVTGPANGGYFGEVAAYLAEQVALLDRRLLAAEAGGSQALASLDSQLAEVEDVLAYAADLLSLRVPAIAQLMADALWQRVVRPLVLQPLREPAAAGAPPAPAAPAAPWQPADFGRQGSAAAAAAAAARVRPMCAVYVAERIFQLLTYTPLLQQLLLALACGGSSSDSSSSSCRGAVLGMLSGGQALPALLVLRMLVAVLNNRQLPPELLAGLSLLPRKQLQALSGGDDADQQQQFLQQQASLAQLVQAVVVQLQQSAAAGAASGGQEAVQHASGLQGQRCAADAMAAALSQRFLVCHEQQQQQLSAAALSGRHHRRSSSVGVAADSLQPLEDAWLQLQQQQQQQGGQADATAGAFSAFGQQLLSGLMQLLQLPDLPPLGLWLVGWLLHQLLPTDTVAGAAESGAGAAAPARGQQQARHDGAAALDGTSLAGSSTGGEADDAGDRGCSSPDDVQDPLRRQSSSSSSDASQASSSDEQLQQQRLPPISTQRAASVQSSHACFEPRASVLSERQQQVLQDALQHAHVVFAQQLRGMWCEAVFPLLALEWPAARETLLRPVLRASSYALLSGTAVWPLLEQQLAGQQLSTSAQAALDCYQAVQRVVALTQMQELLRVGCIACSPPVPTVSEADLKQVDIQEGYQVDLAPGSALPCVVSFAPGQERRVFFAVAGLSKKQLAVLQGQPTSTGGGAAAVLSPEGPAGSSSGALAAAAAAAAANQASLLRSLPVAVLADPSPSRPQAGVVLSVAPLLGSHPYTDAQVPKWLHVHVRPSVRGLLRIIRSASGKKGGLLSAMRQLADGHWVLAFSAADKAALAVMLVQQHTARLQALYGEALAPLALSSSDVQQQPGEQDDDAEAGQQQGVLAAADQLAEDFSPDLQLGGSS